MTVTQQGDWVGNSPLSGLLRCCSPPPIPAVWLLQVFSTVGGRTVLWAQLVFILKPPASLQLLGKGLDTLQSW
jgi:hypothetical protein